MLSMVSPVSFFSSAGERAVVAVLDRDLLGQQLLAPRDDAEAEQGQATGPGSAPSTGV